MKKLNKFMCLALSASMLLSFTSCDPDSDDEKIEFENVNIVLPEPVGENPFAGKTFTINSENPFISQPSKYTFTNDTCTISQTMQSGEDSTIEAAATYSYSYNATDSLLYLALRTTQYLGAGDSMSFSDLKNFISLGQKSGADTAELQYLADQASITFSTPAVCKYTIQDDKFSAENYFDGTLPCQCSFKSDSAYLSAEGISFSSKTDDAVYNIMLFYDKDRSFHGRVYSTAGETISLTGTVKGTYTSTGKGTSGCKVSLTFTDLPEGIKSFSKGMPYIFEQMTSSLY